MRESESRATGPPHSRDLDIQRCNGAVGMDALGTSVSRQPGHEGELVAKGGSVGREKSNTIGLDASRPGNQHVAILDSHIVGGCTSSRKLSTVDWSAGVGKSSVCAEGSAESAKGCTYGEANGFETNAGVRSKVEDGGMENFGGSTMRHERVRKFSCLY